MFFVMFFCFFFFFQAEDGIRDAQESRGLGDVYKRQGIYGRILKEGSTSITKALYLIFKRSITFGEVPEDWKIAYVVPIYKKGSKEDLGNYRPVSLTSLVVKVLEKLLKGHIEKYLEDNKVLYD